MWCRTMINFANRWDEIDRPSRVSTSLRVAVEHQLNLYVGYSDDRRREFKLKSRAPVFQETQLPEFENIEIKYECNSENYELCITLCDNSLKDLFSAIASDLVNASSTADTEEGAANIFMNRLRRWAGLLEERRRRGLTLAQQLGLLGELSFLHWLLSKDLSSSETIIRGWRGPDGDARDINLGSISVEVKAALGTSKNVLNISSLDQLDTEERQLVVSHCRFSPSDSGISLSSLVTAIDVSLSTFSSERSDFWRKLFLAGYDPEAKYIEDCYEILKHTFYEVSRDFPRLTKGTVHSAIRSAKYQIDCAALANFEIDEAELGGMIHGGN